MKNQIFRAAIAATLLIVVGASANAQAVNDPYTALEGRWIWVGNRDNPGVQKACAEKWTEFKFSPDRKVLTYRYLSDGAVKSGTYNVLYDEQNNIAMYLNGESRHLKSGDRLIWVAIVESRDRFLWRIHGQTTAADELAKYARIRCPN